MYGYVYARKLCELPEPGRQAAARVISRRRRQRRQSLLYSSINSQTWARSVFATAKYIPAGNRCACVRACVLSECVRTCLCVRVHLHVDIHVNHLAVCTVHVQHEMLHYMQFEHRRKKTHTHAMPRFARIIYYIILHFNVFFRPSCYFE